MDKWIFENGTAVYEQEHDGDLHKLAVYNGKRFLGYVYPATYDDMAECVTHLDAGEDPITGLWDDGCGNACTKHGWGFDTWGTNTFDPLGWRDTLSTWEQESLILAAREDAMMKRVIVENAAKECPECADAIREIMTAEGDEYALALYWGLGEQCCDRIAAWAKSVL